MQTVYVAVAESAFFVRGFVLHIFCLSEKQETQITSNQTAESSVYTVNHLVSEVTAMKKAICWMIAVLFLLTLGCSNKEAEAMQQGDMFDALANGSIQSAANNETTSVQQRSHTVTVDGETVPWCFCLYDVLPDGTARLDSLEDGRSLGWMIPEAIDGYVVSTLGRNMLSEALAIDANFTIPDCVTKIEGNPFDCLGLSLGSIENTVSKISVSQTHPTLEVVDGVLFSKPDKRLVCACGRIGSEDYFIPEGTLTIEDHAFCNAFISNGTIHIPDSVTTIGRNPFALCNKSAGLTITVSENHPVLEIVDQVLFSKADHRLVCLADRRATAVQYSIPDGTEIIDDLAFYLSIYQEYIFIPASVKEIRINPFLYLQNVSEIALDDSNQSFEIRDGLLYDKAEKRLISFLFKGNHNVAIQNGTEIIGAFAFANKFAFPLGSEVFHISVPSSIKEIGNYAFYNNWSMTCDIPVSVHRIGVGAYYDCIQLKNTLLFGGGVIIEEFAFAGMSGGVVGITGLTIIDDGGATIKTAAFANCRDLKKIIISKGDSYIGEAAFASCESLEEVSFAEGIVSIGNSAFMNCTNLQGRRIDLPASLKYIGDLWNNSYTEVTMNSDGSKHDVEVNECTANIYVTAGSYAEQYCKENGISYQYSK